MEQPFAQEDKFLVDSLKRWSALLTIHSKEPSLFSRLLAYQADNAKKEKSAVKKKSGRVETTLFVVEICKGLRTALSISDLNSVEYAKAVEDKFAAGKINKAEALYAIYNGWVALKTVLDAQKKILVTEVGDESERKLVTSVFLNIVLNALNTELKGGLLELVKPMMIVSQQDKIKAKIMLDKVIMRLGEQIAECEQQLQPYVDSGQLKLPVQLVMAQAKSEAAQGLVVYCAEQEKESAKAIVGKAVKVSKREHICKNVLPAYFLASTPEDYVKLFTQIAEGIRISRSKGKNGAISRRAEHALVALRDEVLWQAFFANEHEEERFRLFTKEQLLQIADEISYCVQMENGRDAEVAPLAIPFIAWTEHCYFGTGELNGLRVKHLDRLILELLARVNGEEVKMADVLHSKGNSWAATMSALLEDPTLSDDGRVLVGVMAYVWNHFMAEKNADASYLVKIESVSFQEIADHSRLPARFKKEVDALCKTAVAKTQASLASVKRGELLSRGSLGGDHTRGLLAETDDQEQQGQVYDDALPPLPANDEPRLAAALGASMSQVTRSRSASQEDIAQADQQAQQAAVNQSGRTSPGI